MKKEIDDNIYAEGQIVFAKSNPGVKLIIRRYIDRMYYCRTKDDASLAELALFEREITDKQGVK